MMREAVVINLRVLTTVFLISMTVRDIIRLVGVVDIGIAQDRAITSLEPDASIITTGVCCIDPEHFAVLYHRTQHGSRVTWIGISGAAGGLEKDQMRAFITGCDAIDLITIDYKSIDDDVSITTGNITAKS